MDNKTQKTPGYNCRLSIFFKTNTQGRKVAYRWSPMQLRAFRMGLAEAENFAAQDLVDVLPGHPLKGNEEEKVQAQVEEEEKDLTWDQVEIFDKESTEHLNALVTVVIRAGRGAYAVDLAVGEALMPKHSRVDLNAREDALPMWERGKGYAASFMAQEKVRFGNYRRYTPAWLNIYQTIYIWWAYGYDHAARGE